MKVRFVHAGAVRTDAGAITQTDFGCTFQRSLPEAGLMDYHARFYIPALGRFTQPDTLVPGAGNPHNLNRYSYVRNNPMLFTDPSGHKTCEDVDKKGNCVGDKMARFIDYIHRDILNFTFR